jgi:hypothetical protein
MFCGIRSRYLYALCDVCEILVYKAPSFLAQRVIDFPLSCPFFFLAAEPTALAILHKKLRRQP